MPVVGAVSIRPYEHDDASGWLRCRLLSFFESSYFDDVHTVRTEFDAPAVQLVATDRDRIVGLLDLEIVRDELATIDVIAVLPESQGAGIATALLSAAIGRLPAPVTTLDAWTREDAAANAWYEKNGFRVVHRYLHVYVGDGDPLDGFATPDGLSLPVSAFLHARIEHEAELRRRYARVHECRRYARRVR